MSLDGYLYQPLNENRLLFKVHNSLDLHNVLNRDLNILDYLLLHDDLPKLIMGIWPYNIDRDLYNLSLDYYGAII